MPKIAIPNPDGKGIYRRKKTYWLRHTVDGQRFFQSLKTRDYGEAVQNANKIRGIRPHGKAQAGEWDKAIAKYLVDKLSGKRPAHLAGRRLRAFRPSTASRVESSLKVFADRCKAASPGKVTIKMLQDYYEVRAKNSEAGARSTLATVQAFLDHVGCLPGRVLFASERKPEARQVVVPIETSNQWIKECPRGDLKFVFYCGFHTGLRRGEIRHSRPKWFDLKRRVLTVPGKELQKLPNGKEFTWKSKDGELREIPLSQEFCNFMVSFLEQPREFCLLSKRLNLKRKSSTGLFDFRAPFMKFVKERGCPEVTRHAMRHSWISELCNSGNHSITEVAAWSGDTIETIQANYWKKRVRTGGLDDTMAGRRSSDALKEVAATLQKMSTVGLDAETRDAINRLMTAAKKTEDGWKWTKQAPVVHANMYSVEDTVTKFLVFQELISPGDGEPEDTPTFEDWEKGKISTIRARLRVLENRGLIGK